MRGRLAGAATALAFCGLVAGGCSGSGSPTAAQHIATFVAVDAGASSSQLTADARELTTRLHSLGDADAAVVTGHHAVVVSGGTRLPLPASLLLATGSFQLRPALCQADRYTPAPGSVLGMLPNACSSSRYSLQPPNLTDDDATGISNVGNIPPDPALSSYPSTSVSDNDGHPDSTVLVPALGQGGARYLLGPTELEDPAVASVRATFQPEQWVVDITLTGRSASAWDALARRYFHALIAVDIDGQAVSVPITEPAEAQFTSFAGRLQISGSFSQRSARAFAAYLESGPLTTPLSG